MYVYTYLRKYLNHDITASRHFMVRNELEKKKKRKKTKKNEREKEKKNETRPFVENNVNGLLCASHRSTFTIARYHLETHP